MISSKCGSDYFLRLHCLCRVSGQAITSEYSRGINFSCQAQNYFKNCVKIFWANQSSNIIDSMVYQERKRSLNMKFLGGIFRGCLGGYPGGRPGPKTFTASLGAQEN